ncbi:MAG: glycoside hydrolase [Bacteroidaceae bacterium]|nr:glycoside hydrolase [Bacteroidaceae bacterium]
MNTWLAFRRNVTLDAVPESVEALVAADSKYWIWLNGKLIVFEGGLKRGPSPRDSYFDKLELAPFLRRGTNRLAILVWHFGRNGMSHINSGKAGLLFSAPTIGLLSDASWKSRLHPAYSTCEGPQTNWRLPESNILFDARRDIDGWQTDDALHGFAASREIGQPGDAPWNGLVERPIPQWKDYGLQRAKYETRKGQTADTIVARLPYNMHITPWISISDTEGGHNIYIQTDHPQVGTEVCVHAEYITRRGSQQYESLGWMNGDELQLIVPHGVIFKQLMYRQTAYDSEAEGTFSCDDNFYNEYWLKALRTLHVNMRDTYYDCPDRERSQWWGDETSLTGEAFYTFDTRAHALMKKGMLELCEFQRPDGVLHAPIPGTYDTELPSQMLASISLYGFWNYFMQTGDTAIVERVYPHVKAYLSRWRLEDSGLTAAYKGEWNWGDWGNHRDMRLIYAGWHYLALASAAQMADLLALPVEAQTYRNFMAAVKRGYNACWNGTAYRHPDYQGDTDDRVQALAVVAGIAEREKWPQITQLLHTQKHASPYMEKYVMEALFMMNEGEYAMERGRERYREMVEDPLHTTLYEGWGSADKGFSGGTVNHAWSGGALTVIAQYLMGISPTKAGWQEFQVKPQPVCFKRASITVPTVRGTIGVSYQTKGEHTVFSITVPQGTICRFVNPKTGIGQTLAAGKHRITI